MAEVNSRTAAAVAAGTKVIPAESYGNARWYMVRTPVTHSLAQNDVLVGGVKIPEGTIILPNILFSHAAMGASVTVDVGLRNFHTKAEIDLDGLVVGEAVSTAIAGPLAEASIDGALINDGAICLLAEDAELVVTFEAADPTDDAQFMCAIATIGND